MSQHQTRIPWYAAAAVVGAATALLFFALPSNADDDQPEGPIVQIGPDDSVLVALRIYRAWQLL